MLVTRHHLHASLLAVVMVVSLVVGFVIITPLVSAQDLGLQYATGTGLASTDIRIIIARIIRIALGFLGILAVAIMLYGGFIWMTSGGAEEKIQQAKRIIIDGAIGLAIIILAFSIATFVLNALMRASGMIPFGQPPATMLGRGALGGGIIESHYPPRGAHCVSASSDNGCIARNTSIVVTFKERMSLSTIIDGYNDQGTPFDLTGDNQNLKDLDGDGTAEEMELNYDNIKIFSFVPGDDIEDSLAANAFDGSNGRVQVTFTDDMKTFVFKPIDENPLGSASERMWYMVRLDEGIKKINSRGGQEDAFPDRPNYYQWNFEVGTFLDLTPPRVESVYPTVNQVDARNVVIQINFNEAVDPTAVSGVARRCTEEDNCDSTNDVTGFDNILVERLGTITTDPQTGQAVRDGNGDVIVTPLTAVEQLGGTFTIANQYQTVEFTTDVIGGVNSCGDEIFVLPANSQLNVIVKAAPLKEMPPNPAKPTADWGSGGYRGAVDMAANALNGNGFNGVGYNGFNCQGQAVATANHQECAIGPDMDNFFWPFFTNNKIIAGTPPITDLWPAVRQINITEFDRPSNARFGRIMMARTLTSDQGAITLQSVLDADMPWWIGADNVDTPDQTNVIVYHDPFIKGQGTGDVAVRYDYSTEFTGRVKDIYQNCFVPTQSISSDPTGSAPDCQGDPSCCNATPVVTFLNSDDLDGPNFGVTNCPQPLPVIPE